MYSNQDPAQKKDISSSHTQCLCHRDLNGSDMQMQNCSNNLGRADLNTIDGLSSWGPMAEEATVG